MPAITSNGVRPILNTALFLTAVAMVVRAAGAVKEVLFAGAFGVSADTDAFVLAVTYATFLPTVIGSAVATAVIAERAKATAETQNNLTALAGWVFAAAVGCGITVYALSPLAMSFLFTATGETLNAAIAYARTLSPLGFAMVLSLAMCGLLNSEKQFYAAGASALATPLFTMTAIALFASAWGVRAAAWGMVVGGLVEVAVLAARIVPHRELFFASHSARASSERERSFWQAVAVLSVAAAIASMSPIIDQIFLAKLDTGAVTNLNYASKVNSLLIGLLGTAFGAAIYPYLSDLAARRDNEGLRRLAWRLAGVVLPLTGLITLLVYIFSYDIVALLFARGNFTRSAVEEVGAIQQIFALQLVFYIAGLLAMRVLNAAAASRFVFAISVVGVIANALLDWLLYESMGARGIALASVLTSVVSLVVALALIKPALASSR